MSEFCKRPLYRLKVVLLLHVKACICGTIVHYNMCACFYTMIYLQCIMFFFLFYTFPYFFRFDLKWPVGIYECTRFYTKTTHWIKKSHYLPIQQAVWPIVSLQAANAVSELTSSCGILFYATLSPCMHMNHVRVWRWFCSNIHHDSFTCTLYSGSW